MGVLNCKYCGLPVYSTRFTFGPYWKHRDSESANCEAAREVATPRFLSVEETNKLVKSEFYVELYSDHVDKVTEAQIKTLTRIFHADDISPELKMIRDAAESIKAHIRETAQFL